MTTIQRLLCVLALFTAFLGIGFIDGVQSIGHPLPYALAQITLATAAGTSVTVVYRLPHADGPTILAEMQTSCDATLRHEFASWPTGQPAPMLVTVRWQVAGPPRGEWAGICSMSDQTAQSLTDERLWGNVGVVWEYADGQDLYSGN